MYVQRDENNRIARVSKEAFGDCNEYMAANDPELQNFLASDEGAHARRLRESDLDFVRVLEDVIAVLMEKGIIQFTDLPKEAQTKFAERQSMRSRANSVDLLGESDDDEGII